MDLDYLLDSLSTFRGFQAVCGPISIAGAIVGGLLWKRVTLPLLPPVNKGSLLPWAQRVVTLLGGIMLGYITGYTYYGVVYNTLHLLVHVSHGAG